MTKFSLVSLVCFAAAGACAVACSSDDDPVTNPSAGAGGRSSAGAAGKAGGGAGGSGGSISLAGSGGEGGAIESTLYFRLGERAGIKSALEAIVKEELKDPIIASYFSQQANPAHKPTTDDILGCFTNLLASEAGGPEEYPFTTDSGFKCRDMKTAHQTLGIGAGTFEKFVSIAAGVLTDLNVAPDDVATIGDVLNGTKSSIVDKNVPSGAAPCASPASCAVEVPSEGGAGGAGGEGNEAGEGGTAGATAP
ncbi:MAG: hypothetical protein ABW061_26325 [Polyangiaceae bacterium]